MSPPLREPNLLGRVRRYRIVVGIEIRGDLIVVGQFGLHGKNIPNRVLHVASCPTLVVGMPAAADMSPRCGMCAAVREDSDGERWFCVAHSATAATLDASITPMTTWSAGALVHG